MEKKIIGFSPARVWRNFLSFARLHICSGCTELKKKTRKDMAKKNNGLSWLLADGPGGTQSVRMQRCFTYS
jgi:hypothetical protein